MDINWINVAVFVGFIGTVITVSLYASRKEKSSEDYFLAGRKLTWYLIGFSLIASNISTEQFVGMTGSAFTNFGMAVASYEWMSAVVLVMVAWFLLPKFLRAGIFTMPEYLEYRYDRGARTVMAFILMVLYVIVFLSTVLWSGSSYLVDYLGIPQYLQTQFDMSPEAALLTARWAGVWAIALIGAAYTIYGGLGAVVWADLIQGSALLICGCFITYFGLQMAGDGSALDGWQAMKAHAPTAAKMNPIRPWNDPHMPWLAVFIGGLWIPNIFYWGLNQFITQRTLGAKSLLEGQKGILFAAAMKLIMPLAVVLPGIIAFYLVQTNGDLVIVDKDACYSSFMQYVLQGKGWVVGLMFAAICGAVMSSFNSGVNSASTIFTMDLYSKYVNPDADSRRQLSVGRKAAICIVIFACLWSPVIYLFKGVFQYIQEIWGFISPGVVAVFIVGMLFRRVPRGIGKWALVLGVIFYGCFRVPGWVLQSQFPQMGSWMDEKSKIICDENYGLEKLEQITSTTFVRELEEARRYTDSEQITPTMLNRIKTADAKLLAITDPDLSDAVRLTAQFAQARVASGKSLEDYSNADLLSMARVQAAGMIGLGFAPDSDLSVFKSEEFRQAIEARNPDAITALAGYTAEFPAWGYFFTFTFLHHMVLVLALLVVIMLVASKVRPLTEPVVMPTSGIDTTSHPIIYVLGVLVLLATLGVYLIFS